MKTYVLTISLYYPQYHPCAGTETEFIQKIKAGEKLHTIRLNRYLWAKRMAEIQAGKAVLSVRVWTGTPYNSPQAEIFQFTKDDQIGIEALDKIRGQYFAGTTQNRRGVEVPIETLAKNDGLTEQAFKDWFMDESQETVFGMVIIHFSSFRYADKL